jgi:hypothetical protein
VRLSEEKIWTAGNAAAAENLDPAVGASRNSHHVPVKSESFLSDQLFHPSPRDCTFFLLILSVSGGMLQKMGIIRICTDTG